MYWAELTQKFETQLNEVNAKNVRLLTADKDSKLDDGSFGVQWLQTKLGRVLANRGRIWAKCTKKAAGLDPAGMMVTTVSNEESVPNANSLVYAFEEGDEQSPGKYLGEFKVKAVNDKEAVLVSTAQMPRSLPLAKAKSLGDNVMDSKGFWVLYEMMPTDTYKMMPRDTDKWTPTDTDADTDDDELFANLPDEQKKWIESDPKKWDTDDFIRDTLRDANGKRLKDANGKEFRRPSRDYLVIFRDCEMYRTLFEDRMNATINDGKYLAASKEEIINQEHAVEKEKTQVADEQNRAHKERDAAAGHLATVQKLIADNQAAVKDAIDLNLQYYQEIAKRQKEAADKIDRRTRSMAQSGPGATLTEWESTIATTTAKDAAVFS